MKLLSLILLAMVGGGSLINFVLCAIDKCAAKAERRRVPGKAVFLDRSSGRRPWAVAGNALLPSQDASPLFLAGGGGDDAALRRRSALDRSANGRNALRNLKFWLYKPLVWQ